MIFVSNQLTANPMPELEQQLAAYNNLTQSLSEEFDRAHELQAQALQTTCESWSEFFVDLSQLKNPQEFFLRISAQAHTAAGQSQLYLHELINLGKQMQQKIFALSQTISPMMLENIVVMPEETREAPAIAKPPKKIFKDINSVEKTIVPNRTKRKTSVATKVVSAETALMKDTVASTPTPKVRKVKPTIKTSTTEITDIEQAETVAAPAKKSAVVGLPSKPAVKSGFAGAGGQPEFKPKSSKATGAKKRVRQ
nr:phasin family protein [uncultured Undibacterium sp.]